MTKMKLNNSVEFEIVDYNRYTNIEDGQLVSNASFRPASVSVYDDLAEISQSTITDIRIETDGTEIYHLANQQAHIVSISENLYDGRLSISASISFDRQNNQAE